jgi:hypothetical protein
MKYSKVKQNMVNIEHHFLKNARNLKIHKWRNRTNAALILWMKGIFQLGFLTHYMYSKYVLIVSCLEHLYRLRAITSYDFDI